MLVVELKKGRASDAVVGQILRYMGFVRDELAESEQMVRGVVIALDDDQRLRRALAMVSALAVMPGSYALPPRLLGGERTILRTPSRQLLSLAKRIIG